MIGVDDNHGAGVEAGFGDQADRISASGCLVGVVDADICGALVGRGIEGIAYQSGLCGKVQVIVLDETVRWIAFGEGCKVVEETGARVVGDEFVGASGVGSARNRGGLDEGTRGGQRQGEDGVESHLARRWDVVGWNVEVELAEERCGGPRSGRLWRVLASDVESVS